MSDTQKGLNYCCNLSNQSKVTHCKRLIRAPGGRFSSWLGLSPTLIAFLLLQIFIFKTCCGFFCFFFFPMRKFSKSVALLLSTLPPEKQNKTRNRGRGDGMEYLVLLKISLVESQSNWSITHTENITLIPKELPWLTFTENIIELTFHTCVLYQRPSLVHYQLGWSYHWKTCFC